MCDGHAAEGHGNHHCCRPFEHIRGLTQPLLLFALLQRPGHGYELMERLAEDDGAPPIDPGLLYRTLRQLEEEGLLRSRWDTAGSGPARRLYEVTPEGQEFLAAWVVRMRDIRQRLDRFIGAYERHQQQARRTEDA